MAVCYEPFLLDEKMLPMLDEVEPPRAMLVPNNQLKMEYIKPDTQSLLKEFETVYVELNSSGALTPPQSPPMDQQQQQQQPMLTTLEPLLQPIKYHHLNHHQQQQQHHHVADQQPQTPYSVPDKQLLYRNIPVDYPPVATPQPDIAHELAVVEELVRTRVEDMQWTSSSGPSSPNSSSSSSGSSNFGDCSSDDPEWIPEPIESYADAVPGLKPKKRSKPYARTNPDDKKSRKKEQNKNAATRYRLKKKAEVEEILLEEKQLLDHSAELGTKITDLQREIKYLKGLMRDLFKAKGLIN
ncbi:activating transcription factor of chaperone isoform X2 [Aethina tumida]|uniref:activating transcription factor of chaperone isoform X2 n=1 Tax=Aethina tumida TaxID=116153 RepID=UPI0021485FB5|nr:activating transcription factor of chaperone isoform X2 [Aethina tumida]